MKVLKWIFIFLIILILAIITGLAYRAAIVQSLLPLLAEEKLYQAGIRLQQLKIDKIGGHQTQISSLIFNLNPVDQTASSAVYQVRVKGIKLQYSNQDLFIAAQGKVVIDKIMIRDLQITKLTTPKKTFSSLTSGMAVAGNASVPADKSRQNVPASIKPSTNKIVAKKRPLVSQSVVLRQLFRQFQTNWREKIPFKQLYIDTLQLHGNPFKGFNNRRISLDFHKIETAKENTELSLRLNIPDLPEELTVKISSANTISINLDQSRTALLHIILSDKVIRAEYQLNIQKIIKLLQKLDFMDIKNSRLSAGRKEQVTKEQITKERVTKKQVAAFIIDPISGKITLPVAMLLQDGMPPKNQRINNADKNIIREKQSARKELALVTLTGNQIRWQGGGVEHPEASFIFNINALKNGSQIVLHRGSFIRYKKLDIDDTQIKNAVIKLYGNIDINPANEKNAAYGSDTAFAINIASRSILALQRFTNGRLIQLKGRDVILHITKANEKIKFNGHLFSAELPAKFSFNGSHNIQHNHGMLTIDTDREIKLSADSDRLSRLVKPWPYLVDIISGRVALHASMQWWANKPFQLSTRLQMKNVGGFYQQIVFSGLNTVQNFNILPVLQTVKSMPEKRIGHTGLIRLKHLDSGVLISNIHLQLVLNHEKKYYLPVITLHNLEGHIFDGRFYSRKITLDFNHPVNRFTLKIRNINLASIARSQPLPGLSVDGKLDGVLPIELNQQGIYIHQGYFDNAGRKGYIRYQPKTGKGQISTSPLSTIVLKALRDFRYSKLAANLSYTPDGRMSAALHLAGVSPELGKNQRVKLNINTQQNIKDLLKSLRYTQGLNDSIDAAVRKKYH